MTQQYPVCHWIRGRSVTVISLLTYATWNGKITQNHLKTDRSVREAPTKEVLHAKIAELRCYIELVETILKGVTEISDAENPIANAQNQINMISTVV